MARCGTKYSAAISSGARVKKAPTSTALANPGAAEEADGIERRSEHQPHVSCCRGEVERAFEDYTIFLQRSKLVDPALAGL